MTEYAEISEPARRSQWQEAQALRERAKRLDGELQEFGASCDEFASALPADVAARVRSGATSVDDARRHFAGVRTALGRIDPGSVDQ